MSHEVWNLQNIIYIWTVFKNTKMAELIISIKVFVLWLNS